jgi:hypothetical protein
MSTPSHPPDEAPDRPRPGSVEAALDKALDETFPASDAINLHQWTEMENEDAVEKPAETSGELDRLARYLLGPTVYCA